MMTFEEQWQRRQEEARQQEEKEKAFADQVRQAQERIARENRDRAWDEEVRQFREWYELEAGQELSFGRWVYYSLVKNPLRMVVAIAEHDLGTFCLLVVFGPLWFLGWLIWDLLIRGPAVIARDCFVVLKWLLCWAIAVGFCVVLVVAMWLAYRIPADLPIIDTEVKVVRAAQLSERRWSEAEAAAEKVGRWVRAIRMWLREEEPRPQPHPQEDEEGSPRPEPQPQEDEEGLRPYGPAMLADVGLN